MFPYRSSIKLNTILITYKSFQHQPLITGLLKTVFGNLLTFMHNFVVDGDESMHNNSLNIPYFRRCTFTVKNEPSKVNHFEKRENLHMGNMHDCFQRGIFKVCTKCTKVSQTNRINEDISKQPMCKNSYLTGY